MIRFNETMPRERARGLNPVVLAFVGDAAYSLYVREQLVYGHDYKTGMLQKLSSQSVCAKAQAALAEKLSSIFTEEEKEIFLRGRAVIGFLYLIGDYARIQELLSGAEE